MSADRSPNYLDLLSEPLVLKHLHQYEQKKKPTSITLKSISQPPFQLNQNELKTRIVDQIKSRLGAKYLLPANPPATYNTTNAIAPSLRSSHSNTQQNTTTATITTPTVVPGQNGPGNGLKDHSKDDMQ